MLDINSLTLCVVNVLPSIAQLVERRTVVVGETSIGWLVRIRLEGLFLTNLFCFRF